MEQSGRKIQPNNAEYRQFPSAPLAMIIARSVLPIGNWRWYALDAVNGGIKLPVIHKSRVRAAVNYYWQVTYASLIYGSLQQFDLANTRKNMAPIVVNIWLQFVFHIQLSCSEFVQLYIVIYRTFALFS